MMLNDALTHSAVLIQVNTHTEMHTLSFSVAVHVCFVFLVWINQLQGVFVFVAQGHGMHGHGETVHIAFPFDEEDLKAGESLL